MTADRLWRAAEMAARLFLGVMFFTGGMSKLVPFPGIMGPVWLEEALEPHGLAMFARFVAWSELLIGALLFSRRLAVIGAVMMVPLLVNIFMVTVSLGWQGTPYVVAVFLSANAVLLWVYRGRLLTLVQDRKPTDEPGTPAFGPWRDEAPALAGVLLCLAGPLCHAISALAGYLVIGAGLLLLAAAPAVRRFRRRRPDPDPVR